MADRVKMAESHKDVVRIVHRLTNNRISKNRGYSVVLYEAGISLNEDLTALSYIRTQLPEAYLILLADSISPEERKVFLKVGINDTLPKGASPLEIISKMEFVERKKDVLMGKKEHYGNIPDFKIPMWKRIFDLCFAGCALLLLSPVMLLTAIAIKIESKGPVFYTSKRVGSNYKIFDFYKFRSMYVDSDQRLKELGGLNRYDNEEKKETGSTSPLMSTVNEDDVMLVSDDFVISEKEHANKKDFNKKSVFVKLQDDPRVTRVGRIIRKLSIDELPQLVNIIQGNMSVVGNRPLPLYEAELLTDDESIDRFMAPAGLTGLWQVEKRGDNGRLSAEERKRLDVEYAKHYSLMMDIKIILRTLTAFIQKGNT
ncbi:MAG: sugar transferase [Bacteroidaceae bacterium]|nr:sugar transferase [Bacteroidaceae bacterium]